MLSLPRSASELHPLHLTISSADSSCEPHEVLFKTSHQPPPTSPTPPFSSRLVTCSTCNNHIVLPRYCSRDQLVCKLRISVAEKTFGLA
jgi:hypothetical protein